MRRLKNWWRYHRALRRSLPDGQELWTTPGDLVRGCYAHRGLCRERCCKPELFERKEPLTSENDTVWDKTPWEKRAEAAGLEELGRLRDELRKPPTRGYEDEWTRDDQQESVAWAMERVEAQGYYGDRWYEVAVTLYEEVERLRAILDNR